MGKAEVILARFQPVYNGRFTFIKIKETVGLLFNIVSYNINQFHYVLDVPLISKSLEVLFSYLYDTFILLTSSGLK